jgi:hypothetical protein
VKRTKRTSEARKVAVLFVGLVIALCLWSVQESMSAGSSGSTNSKPGANADTGRSIFNGKGLCYYCHGMDGDVDKRPQLAPDTAAFIAELDPKPADLRSRKGCGYNPTGNGPKSSGKVIWGPACFQRPQ